MEVALLNVFTVFPISGCDTAAGSVKNHSHLAVLVLLLTSSVHADIWTLVSVYKLEKDTVKDERSLHVVYILENIPPSGGRGYISRRLPFI
jgi:hypothetical protein